MTDNRGVFTQRQRTVLLQGIDVDRVAKRAAERGSRVLLSYLEQADVRAHADRVFGHGGWDAETLDCTLLFEEQIADGRWNVGYRVTMQVTVYEPINGRMVCRYSETAAGTPMGPMKDRGDAHDMAIKTAASDALKRCFINLGDQFGLSLYWKGRTAPVVQVTLVHGDETALPTVPPPPSEDDEAPVPESGTPEPPLQASPDAEAADTLFQAVLDEVRVAAVIPDSDLRLMALAQIKQRCTAPLLARTTQVRGATLTLGALIDQAATGAFVPAEQPA